MMTEEQVKELTKDIQRRIKSTNRWLSANKSIGNPEGEAFRQIEIYELALAALTQPASPAFKLPPSIEPEDVPGLIDATANPDEYACCVGKDVWDACLREVAKLNAPHTAQIEPICATGGAEWVKCSERMPLALSDEHISDVEVIVTDGMTVGTCEYRQGFMPRPWAEWSNYGDIDADKITHWIPLPAAPAS